MGAGWTQRNEMPQVFVSTEEKKRFFVELRFLAQDRNWEKPQTFIALIFVKKIFCQTSPKKSWRNFNTQTTVNLFSWDLTIVASVRELKKLKQLASFHDVIIHTCENWKYKKYICEWEMKRNEITFQLQPEDGCFRSTFSCEMRDLRFHHSIGIANSNMSFGIQQSSRPRWVLDSTHF